MEGKISKTKYLLHLLNENSKIKLKDLLILKTNIYKDKRGFFKEVEKRNILKQNFIFDCFSFSKKNTLRGLHLQKKKITSENYYCCAWKNFRCGS